MRTEFVQEASPRVSISSMDDDAIYVSRALEAGARGYLSKASAPEVLYRLFAGTWSELGAFESGVLASLIGTVPAVFVGGLGALIATGVWMRVFPAPRRADRLPVL